MDWRSHPYIPPNDHLFWFLHKVVYRKAEINPFNATEFASNMASLLSSLVTVILLSKQI